MSETKVVWPGQALGSAAAINAGQGTHIHEYQVIASVAGHITSTKPSKGALATVSITRPSADLLLPEVGTIVLGRITRTMPRQATLSILTLQPTLASMPHTLNEPLPALIRQQDIRLTEVDKVKVNEMFRVGDVVRAVVISLGDERSYYCSTAKNELGVIMATSEAGNPMVPVSWREFMDSETGTREGRKVAKVV